MVSKFKIYISTGRISRCKDLTVILLFLFFFEFKDLFSYLVRLLPVRAFIRTRGVHSARDKVGVGVSDHVIFPVPYKYTELKKEKIRKE